MSEQAQVIAQFETPLGPVLLRVTGADKVSAAAEILDLVPELPAGMRVDRALRIDLRLAVATDIAPLQIAFELEAPHVGSAETGEWLESMRFGANGTQLSLATREVSWMLTHGVDRKFVPTRMRADEVTADYSAWSLHYTTHGFVIEITQLERGDIVICPLAAAYASGQPDSHSDESTWFAVDYVLP